MGSRRPESAFRAIKVLILIVLVAGFGVFWLGRSSKLTVSGKSRFARTAAHPKHSPAQEPLKTLPDVVLPAETDNLDDHGIPIPAGAIRRLGNVFLKHGLSISALLFVNDGRILLSCGDDKTISWWDPASGREIRRIPSWDQVSQMLPLPDNERFVAIESYRPIFQIRRISDGKLLQRLISDELSRQKRLFTCSPDLEWYATTASGSVIQLWNAQSGQPEQRLSGLPGHAAQMAFSEDSISLKAVDGDGNYCLWSMPDWQIVASGSAQVKLAGKTRFYGANRFVVSADAEKVAYCLNNEVRVWDCATESDQFKASVGSSYVTALSLSADGSRLAAGNSAGFISVWPVHGLVGEEPPAVPQNAIQSLAFSEDGSHLLSVDSDGRLVNWCLRSGRQVSAYYVASSPFIIKTLDRERALLVANGKFVIWSLSSETVLAKIGENHFSGGYTRCPAAVSMDGRKVALTARTKAEEGAMASMNLLQVWDVESLQQIASFPCPERLAGLALSPDGSSLALTTLGKPGMRYGEGQELIGYDVISGSEKFNMPIPTKMNYISLPSYTRRGSLMVTGGSYEKADGRGGVSVQESATGEKIGFYSCLSGFVGQERMSPDGVMYASTGWGDFSVVHVGPWRSWKIRDLKGHRGRVSAVAFSPGGRYLATGGQDSTILIWDLHQAESALPQSQTPMSEIIHPEAPTGIPPMLHLSFDGIIHAEPLAQTSLSKEIAGMKFVAGRNDKALRLFSNDSWKLELHEGCDVVLPGQWTVELWFRLIHDPVDRKLAYIEVFECDLLSFVITAEGKAIVFYRFPNRGGHGNAFLFKGSPPASGRWHHLAIAWEGVKGKLRVHLDGATAYETRQNLGSVLGPLGFGRGGGKGETCSVDIDDLKVYSYARRPEDIARESGYIEDPNQ
ncbi:MAG: hypothetical protein GQF41_2639 [Candidatus Rifleibacterium amylolyticum]|nr:MAG: hypothetical protein GQF41_2639 [Candidatus Rifleibacterium amylolyticum]